MQLLIKKLELSPVINEQWIKENCYIAGGACVSNATRQPIHDVDLYFKTKEARDDFIFYISHGRYITINDPIWSALSMYARLLENGTIELGDDKEFDELKLMVSSDEIDDVWQYEIFEITNGQQNLVTKIPDQLFRKQEWMFANGYDYVLLEKNHFEVDNKEFYGNKSITIKKDEMTYQFILRFYGEPQEMMDETFDFQHCKIAYDLATNTYISSEETWQALCSRELIYVNSFYPLSTLKRMYKYGSRGYKWNNDVFVKIVKDIHDVDVDNKFVIEDQLIGYYEDFDYNKVFGSSDTENNQ